jgi:hypothetical protein
MTKPEAIIMRAKRRLPLAAEQVLSERTIASHDRPLLLACRPYPARIVGAALGIA